MSVKSSMMSRSRLGRSSHGRQQTHHPKGYKTRIPENPLILYGKTAQIPPPPPLSISVSYDITKKRLLDSFAHQNLYARLHHIPSLPHESYSCVLHLIDVTGVVLLYPYPGLCHCCFSPTTNKFDWHPSQIFISCISYPNVNFMAKFMVIILMAHIINHQSISPHTSLILLIPAHVPHI